MKQLATIAEWEINPDKSEVDAAGFYERSAARAVLLNDKGQTHLLHVTKHGYHKLPGGGIDEGESPEQALKRELLEEVGCHAEITAELGTILEYRTYDDGTGLKQTSYSYVAQQIGEQQEAALEEDEIAKGMQQILAGSIDEAIALLAGDKPLTPEGRMIQKRDITILNAAKAVLGES